MADTPAGFREVLGSDPFDIPLDINRAERFLEDYFGASVATAQQLPANGGRPGRTIWVLSENCGYVWDGTQWRPVNLDTGWVVPPVLGGYAGSGLGVRRVGDWVVWRGGLARTSIPWTAADNQTPINAIPPQFQPDGGTWVGLSVGYAVGVQARIAIAGASLTVGPNPTMQGTNYVAQLGNVRYFGAPLGG